MQLQLTKIFKDNVIAALLEQRKLFGDTDAKFAKKWRINPTIFSRIKNNIPYDGLVKDETLLEIGRKLGISHNERKWNIARTDVFIAIEQDVLFCKKYSKSRMCCDEAEIGKSTTARYLSRTLPNCFYIDASEVEGKQRELIKLLAKTLGLSTNNTFVEIISSIKYYLNMLEEPIVIIDEAGDLESAAVKCLKGLWNGTEGSCAWYLIGADGLRAIMERGIKLRKPGFKELNSRFSSTYTKITPQGINDQQAFYHNMIHQVLEANNAKKDVIKTITKKCLVQDGNGLFGGLRRAESLLLLENEPIA